MFTSLVSRPWIARSALISLVAGSVLVGSAPANATGIGPQAPQAISFNRYSEDSRQLSINDGESMNITSTTSVTSDWAGWPLKKGAKLTRTPLVATLTPLAASSDAWRYWNGYNQENQDCEGVWDDAVGHTMTAVETCIDTLDVVDNVSVDNNSGSPKTISFNTPDQILKNGKTVLSGKEGVNSSLVGQVMNYGGSATTVAGEDGVNISFRGCIDEGQLNTSGEDLTVEITVTRGGVSLERSVDYDLWASSDYTDTDSDPDVITYAAPSESDFGGPLENLEVQIDAYLYDATAGTYSGTIDVKDASNQSVLEECPADNQGPSFPTQVSRLEYAAQPAMDFSSQKFLPANIDQNQPDFGLYSSTADGFGGLFYLTYASDPYADGTPPTATIVHMESAGPDEEFNNSTGVLSTPVGRYGQLDLGRYDTNGSKWFAIAPSSTSWSVKLGSMTAGASTTTTISSKTLAKSCPKGYKPIYLSGMSAPTANPMASLLCTKGQQMSYGIVSLSTAGSTLVKQLGSATTTRPCVIPQIGMNPSATASGDIALAIYTRTSSRGDDGSCGAVGATTSTRAITTITKAGTTVTSNVNVDPWGADHEPGSAELAPANDDGTSWIGISSTSVYNGEPSFPDYTFTISNAATSPTLSVDKSDTVTFDHDFGPWAGVRPLARVSDSSWLVAIQGETSFDGDTTAKYAVSVLNVSTGQITDGQVGEMIGYGPYVTGRIASTLSVKSGKPNGATWYVLTDDEHYYASPWTYSIG